jgi:hypothetical protein
MDSIDKTQVTPESVWAALMETRNSILLSREELDRGLNKSREEFDRGLNKSREEFDRGLKESREEYDLRSKESQEKFGRSQEGFDQRLKESQEKFDRGLKESREEFDQRLKESKAYWENYWKEVEQERKASQEDWKQQMKNVNEMIGGIGNTNGMVAEEFFFNALENSDKKLFGEQFDQCFSNIKRYNKDKRKKTEHDIMLINGKSVALVEVKYKARKEDVEKLMNRPSVFRELYPNYKSHRIYLGLAAMAFDTGVEDESINNGVAVFKQVGATIVINDEHLKVY